VAVGRRIDVLVRPVIGIAAETLGQAPVHTSPGWVVEQRYIQVLAGLGAVPWIIPLLMGDEETLKSIYPRLDGVFLTGGVDIDPVCYQQQRHPLCGRTDPPRDWTEIRLLHWALRDRKPIFGVCRGLQMINVALGGSLMQDVPTQMPAAVDHDSQAQAGADSCNAVMHPVRVAPGTKLRDILRASEIEVNSTHHQAIAELAHGLVASAWAPDGLIEAIEASNKDGSYLVAVQWHPEDMAQKVAPMRQLFQSFLEAATAYQQTRMPRPGAP
jgi:putative glutamine amidotransferase